VFLFALNAFQHSHTDDRLTLQDWKSFQEIVGSDRSGMDRYGWEYTQRLIQDAIGLEGRISSGVSGYLMVPLTRTSVDNSQRWPHNGEEQGRGGCEHVVPLGPPDGLPDSPALRSR
jgi:hypothetical protein